MAYRYKKRQKEMFYIQNWETNLINGLMLLM